MGPSHVLTGWRVLPQPRGRHGENRDGPARDLVLGAEDVSSMWEAAWQSWWGWSPGLGGARRCLVTPASGPALGSPVSAPVRICCCSSGRAGQTVCPTTEPGAASPRDCRKWGRLTGRWGTPGTSPAPPGQLSISSDVDARC